MNGGTIWGWVASGEKGPFVGDAVTWLARPPRPPSTIRHTHTHPSIQPPAKARNQPVTHDNHAANQPTKDKQQQQEFSFATLLFLWCRLCLLLLLAVSSSPAPRPHQRHTTMDDQPLFGESKQSTSIIQWSIATVIALWVVVCWCCSNTCPIVVAIRARSYNRSLFARGARSQYCVIIAIVYGLKGHWEHFVIAGLLLLTVAQLGMAVRRARVARSARCVWARSHQSPNSRGPSPSWRDCDSEWNLHHSPTHPPLSSPPLPSSSSCSSRQIRKRRASSCGCASSRSL